MNFVLTIECGGVSSRVRLRQRQNSLMLSQLTAEVNFSIILYCVPAEELHFQSIASLITCSIYRSVKDFKKQRIICEAHYIGFFPQKAWGNGIASANFLHDVIGFILH